MDALSRRLWGEANTIQDTIPETLQPGADWEIILVPANPRLYAYQEVVFPDLLLGKPGAANKLYVYYGYQRGENLAYPSAPTVAVTQEMKISQVILVDTGSGTRQLIDLTTWGGLDRNDPADIVNEITSVLLTLNTGHEADYSANLPEIPGFLDPATAKQIADTLKTVVGIAVGVEFDMPETVTDEQRFVMLKWTLHSDNWSDRLQAAKTIVLKGSQAEQALPDLLWDLGVDGDAASSDGIFQAVAVIQPDCLPFDKKYDLPAYSAIKENGVSGGGEEDIKSDILAEVEGMKSSFWCQRALSAFMAGGSTMYLGMRVADEAGAAVLPALLELLDDENTMVRIAARAGISSFVINNEAPDQDPALISLSQDPDPLARLAFVKMQETNSNMFPNYQAHTQAMIGLLSDPDLDVRSATAAWIGWYPSETTLDPASGAVAPLIKLLADPDPEIQEDALRNLGRITGQHFDGTNGEQAKAYQSWLDQQK
jgi:hypothetical protein